MISTIFCHFLFNFTHSSPDPISNLTFHTFEAIYNFFTPSQKISIRVWKIQCHYTKYQIFRGEHFGWKSRGWSGKIKKEIGGTIPNFIKISLTISSEATHNMKVGIGTASYTEDQFQIIFIYYISIILHSLYTLFK